MWVHSLLGKDRIEIHSLVGVAASRAFTFTSGGVVYPGFSTTYPLCEIFSGPIDQYGAAGAVAYTFSEALGTITRDNPTTTFTLTWTVAQAAQLAVGDYGFRFLFFSANPPTDATCIKRPFWGRWRHMRGR